MTPWRPWERLCDTNYTSVAKVAKRYLGRSGVPMDGAHDRLRGLAGEYRGQGLLAPAISGGAVHARGI